MSRIRTLPLACALLLGSIALPVFADGTDKLPRGVSATACVEGICEYRLGNGLKVLLFPDNSKPTVTVNITYGVGSAHEGYGETGMAHLLEHLLFKGTPRFADIPGEMKKRGISFNGTTSLERTNYFGSFPANDDTLHWLLEMEADRMVNAFIAQKDLDSEMTVVRNEMESGENNPGSVLAQRLRSAAYHWHNYGNSTIGNRSDVENVPIENLQAFYRRWYQPDNATLIIAGRFDSQPVLKRIQASFGRLKRPARHLPQYWTREPTQDGEREITVRRSADIQLVMLGYRTPAASHPDMPALMVLGELLSHSPGGRLHKALVETRIAPAANAGVSAMQQPDLFSFMAIAPKDGDAAKIEAALLQQAEHIAQTPVSESEVSAAKQRIANAYEQSFNNVNSIGLALSEYLAAGDWRLYFVLRDAMQKVSAEDVNRVAQKYLIASNRTLARFVPTENPVRAEIAAAPAVATLVDGYQGREAVAAGESFDASIENIAQRSEIFTIGDGLQVSLLPKKNRGQTVTLSARFRFADIDNLQAFPNAASVAGMLGSMLLRGSHSLSHEEIDQRFEALKTNAAIGGSMQSASIDLASRRDTLAEALTLAADILKNPSLPETEFEQLRQLAITGAEASRKEPGSIASRAMAARFDPWPAGHPLAHVSLDAGIARLQALQISQLRAFHQQFYGTAAGEIAIVGDFDPATIKPLLAQLFGGWKAPLAYQPIATRHYPVAAERQRFETPDKANAVYLARMNLALNDTHPDYPALLVANHIFGGGGLKSRLAERVRQRDGLSYGIGSQLSADVSRSGLDNAGSFSIRGSAAPENIEALARAVHEELQRLLRDGITAEELADTVDSLLTQRQQGRANDGNIAAMLNSDQYLGRDMLARVAFENRLRALSVAEVNAAMSRHIKPENLSVTVAGDFAKAGEKAE